MRYVRYIPLLMILLNVAKPAQVSAQPIGTQPDINVFIRAGWNTQILNDPTGFLSVEPPGADVSHSFHLAHARLYLHGMLDDRIGYDIKTDLVAGSSLLVASMNLKVDENLVLTGGRLLKPFGRDRSHSRHLLTSLDWSVATNRAVRALRYGFFDTGVMLSLNGEQGFSLRGGLFNGTGPGTLSDTDTGKNFVMRTTLPVGNLEIGANISWLHLGRSMPIKGRDNLAWGVDALFTVGDVKLEGEVIRADDWTSFDTVTGNAPGLWTATLTGSVPLPRLSDLPATELVVRLERFDQNDDVEMDEWYFVVPNLNLSISRSSRFQVGLICAIPANDAFDPGVSGVLLWQVTFF